MTSTPTKKGSQKKTKKMGEGESNTRISLSGRTGAMVMKSVSIFLATGRKVSSASHRQQSGSSTGGAGTTSQAKSTRVRRKMPEDSSLKGSTHHAKFIEALRKKTKFSKYGAFHFFLLFFDFRKII